MDKVLYKLEERPPARALWLSSMQWFVFTIANVITVPIVLGHAFGLPESETAMMTSRTMFLCGMIGLLQALLGHRYPIIEGPAGMWWGVFLVLLQLSRDTGTSTDLLLRQLEWGLMAGAAVFIVLAVTGLLSRVKSLFTPAITGTFLILLAVQVSGSLIGGVLGVGFQGSATVKPHIVLLSVLLIVLTIGLMRKGKGIVKNISVLISLVVGWALYAALGMVTAPAVSPQIAELPRLFPYGPPVFDWGIVITSCITSIILLSNLIASIQVFALAADVHAPNRRFSLGSLITGIGTFFAGCFGTVGIVPLTASASLVALTGIASRLPFLVSSAAVAALGLFPSAGQLLATIPAPVGYAVLFTVFAQLLGFGLRDIQSLPLDQRDIWVVGFSLLAGAGSLFIPGQAWSGLPPLFGFVFGNGLIIGVIIAIVLEHIVFRQVRKSAEKGAGSQSSS